MPLTREQTRTLLAFVADTTNDEIACDDCLAGMAEFADASLIGTEIDDAMRRIGAHLAFCPECKEEYELLLALLEQDARPS